MSSMMSTRLARVARLAAAALVLALTPTHAEAATEDFFLRLDGIDGEAMDALGFEIRPFGPEPHATLLVPAVQKVREAAARMNVAQLACDATVLPQVIVEVANPGGRSPSLRIEMTDVLVTGHSLTGGPGAGGASGKPMEQMTLNFTKVTWTDLQTGEITAYDCTSGRCVCER